MPLLSDLAKFPKMMQRGNDKQFVTGEQGMVLRAPRANMNERDQARFDQHLNSAPVGPAGFQQGVDPARAAAMMAGQQYNKPASNVAPNADGTYGSMNMGGGEGADTQAVQQGYDNFTRQYGAGPSGSVFGNNASGDPDFGPYAATGGTWIPGYDYNMAQRMAPPTDPRTGQPIDYSQFTGGQPGTPLTGGIKPWPTR
jgi:hypothetical protein